MRIGELTFSGIIKIRRVKKLYIKKSIILRGAKRFKRLLLQTRPNIESQTREKPDAFPITDDSHISKTKTNDREKFGGRFQLENHISRWAYLVTNNQQPFAALRWNDGANCALLSADRRSEYMQLEKNFEAAPRPRIGKMIYKD